MFDVIFFKLKSIHDVIFVLFVQRLTILILHGYNNNNCGQQKPKKKKTDKCLIWIY